MLYLGVEIGGTKQQLAVCNGEGSILKLVSERVPIRTGAPDILAFLEACAGELIAAYPDIARVGVGFGGPLETETGRVLISVQIPGWKDFKLKEWFQARLGRETVAVNDTVAGGYAEYRLEAAVVRASFSIPTSARVSAARCSYRAARTTALVVAQAISATNTPRTGRPRSPVRLRASRRCAAARPSKSGCARPATYLRIR